MKVYNPSNEIDLGRSVLWQYDKADRLNSIIFNQQAFYDENVKTFWDDYRNDIFDLETCNTFGLTVWGFILGVVRPSYIDGVEVTFSDEGYRTLLKARLMAMDMTGSMQDINSYMSFLFPDKPISVIDNQNMTITYIFDYVTTAEEDALIAIDNVLPRPAGVEAITVSGSVSEIFGFAGQQLGQLDGSVYAEEIDTEGRIMFSGGIFMTFDGDYLAWE